MADRRFQEPGREDLAPLLLERFRLIAGPVLAGTATFGLLHVLLGEPRLPLLLSMKLGQLGVTAGGLWYAHRRPTRAVIVACMLAMSVALTVVTTATGLVIGNPQTNALLHIVTALASSSFLPWGARAQLASVMVASACAVLPPLVGVPVDRAFWYDLATLAVAFSISLYIAREVEAHTLDGYRRQALTQALADRRADFEAFFLTSNVLLGILDLDDDDFRYDEVNEPLASLFGLTPTSMRGKTGRELGFPATEVARWRSFLEECARTGWVQVAEYRLDVVDPPRWFHVSFAPIRDDSGTARRFCGVGVEVTELKRATDDIRRLNEDLEAQVRGRTALLQAANKDLESFAYSVSHDLRTPLRSIEGFAALLTDEHASELSAPALAQLDRIRGASRHMARLIDDLLMLSRATRAEMRREIVDLTLLARDVARELRSAWPDRRVAVDIAPGMVAWGDPRLLRIAIANLLDNAWKYTQERDEAMVRAWQERRDGETFFRVTDNGCGFDMRFSPKLFQPFQRLHAVDEYAGTGIGLATVARIIRRHEGRVEAVGAPGDGATFSFSVADPPAGEPVAAS